MRSSDTLRGLSFTPSYRSPNFPPSHRVKHSLWLSLSISLGSNPGGRLTDATDRTVTRHNGGALESFVLSLIVLFDAELTVVVVHGPSATATQPLGSGHASSSSSSDGRHHGLQAVVSRFGPRGQ